MECESVAHVGGAVAVGRGGCSSGLGCSPWNGTTALGSMGTQHTDVGIVVSAGSQEASLCSTVSGASSGTSAQPALFGFREAGDGSAPLTAGAVHRSHVHAQSSTETRADFADQLGLQLQPAGQRSPLVLSQLMPPGLVSGVQGGGAEAARSSSFGQHIPQSPVPQHRLVSEQGTQQLSVNSGDNAVGATDMLAGAISGDFLDVQKAPSDGPTGTLCAEQRVVASEEGAQARSSASAVHADAAGPLEAASSSTAATNMHRSSASPAASSVPKRQHARDVSSYVAGAVVGEGMYGVVTMATDAVTGRKCVLKKVKFQNETEGFPITALREIKILKKLQHPNIVKLIEVVTSKPSDHNRMLGDVFLVFEYVDGDAGGLLLWPDLERSHGLVRSYLKQLLEGVAFMHSQNVLHRDLKPANLMITKDNVVKIADFGLAKRWKTGLPMTSKVVTNWYRAPELFLGDRDAGPAVDVWSCGIIFIEFMVGTPPFSKVHDADVIQDIWALCGIPQQDTWPGYDKLPQWPMARNRKNYSRNLKGRYGKHFSPLGLDLLEKLLTLNPAHRITAAEALKHPYFSEGGELGCPKAESLPPIPVEKFHISEASAMRAQMAKRSLAATMVHVKAAVPDHMAKGHLAPIAAAAAAAIGASAAGSQQQSMGGAQSHQQHHQVQQQSLSGAKRRRISVGNAEDAAASGAHMQQQQSSSSGGAAGDIFSGSSGAAASGATSLSSNAASSAATTSAVAPGLARPTLPKLPMLARPILPVGRPLMARAVGLSQQSSSSSISSTAAGTALASSVSVGAGSTSGVGDGSNADQLASSALSIAALSTTAVLSASASSVSSFSAASVGSGSITAGTGLSLGASSASAVAGAAARPSIGGSSFGFGSLRPPAALGASGLRMPFGASISGLRPAAAAASSASKPAASIAQATGATSPDYDGDKDGDSSMFLP